jgi:uncharacterized protein (TIGR00255 family)
MIKSMTAFSQVSNTHETITVDVTIKSVNSRHLDIAFHGPESCNTFEDEIKKIISKTHARGRIDIRLSFTDEAKELEQFEVDETRVASYYQALKKIKDDLNLAGDISIADVLAARNVIIPSKKEQDMDYLWKAIKPAIEAASSGLDVMRKEEGDNLYSDLSSRMDFIEKNLKEIEKDAANISAAYKEKLMDKIAYLTKDTDIIDPNRIAQEAAILADKSDISEEIVRLDSHIKQFRGTLDAKDSQGRKLNFLIQEFNREFNTIGSKAGNASLSHIAVDLKSELEKIREQVQNIE